MAVKKDKQLWWQLCTLVLWQGRPAEGASMLQWSFLLFYSLASYTRHTHVYTRIHTHVYTRCQQSPKKARLSSSRVQTHTSEEPSQNQLGKFCWNSSQDSCPGPVTTQKIFMFWQIPLQACFHAAASHEWKYQLEPGKSNTLSHKVLVSTQIS